MNIAAIGAQNWGHMVGRTEYDPVVPRSLKEMERLVDWHGNGSRWNGWEPSTGYDPPPVFPFNDDIYSHPLGYSME